jgi:hypothetical protein
MTFQYRGNFNKHAIRQLRFVQHVESCQHSRDHRHARSESARWRDVAFDPKFESFFNHPSPGEKRFCCIRYHVTRPRIFVAFGYGRNAFARRERDAIVEREREAE